MDYVHGIKNNVIPSTIISSSSTDYKMPFKTVSVQLVNLCTCIVIRGFQSSTVFKADSSEFK